MYSNYFKEITYLPLKIETMFKKFKKPLVIIKRIVNKTSFLYQKD